MKFSEFYNESLQELESTFISIFAKGRPSYANHFRWLFKNVEKEKLVHKPVFQSIFPWEPYQEPMSKLGRLFGDDFIQALDQAKFKEPLDDDSKEEDMAFHKEIYPYKHQVESWKSVLEEKKSIVVTTGTGSGKTECFMVPILKDLYESKKKQTGINPGVQAIFLYPLNALIASQRKRIHAWCDAISPKVSYGIYTGETPEDATKGNQDKSYPEIIDRKTLRENPPQILFTNPTMLEYLMIRSKDQTLVNQSNDLKWIILDEAHTYNGSSAAEMAILLRRVLQLFGKKPSEVNYAITSATIGDGDDKKNEMNTFISNLTGKDAEKDFNFITGKRIVPTLDSTNGLDKINEAYKLKITLPQINELRKKLNSEPALSLTEICSFLGFKGDITKQLELIDALSVKGSAKVKGSDSAWLPVRAHFYGRSINGVYACTNPECSRYQENHIENFGTLTTLSSQTCPHCNGKMLEVVKCDNCGEFLLEGQKTTIENEALTFSYSMKENSIKLSQLLNEDDGSQDMEEEEEELDDEDNNKKKEEEDSSNKKDPLTSSFLISSYRNELEMPFKNAGQVCYELNSSNGICVVKDKEQSDTSINRGQLYSSCNNTNKVEELLCPSCGEKYYNCKKIMFRSPIESRLLTHCFLKQSPPNKESKNASEMLYEGRKYITFTDNRQGTAYISKSSNIMVERERARAGILNSLIEKEVNNDKSELRKQLDTFESMPSEGIPKEVQEILASQIIDLKKKLAECPQTDWRDLNSEMSGDTELEKMCECLKNDDSESFKEQYLKSIYLDQMGSKAIHGNSLETLGLVHLTYPKINELGITSVPEVFSRFYNYTDSNEALKDWKDFLYICIDYQIRRNSHIYIPDENALKCLITRRYYSDPIYSPDLGLVKYKGSERYCKRFPILRKVNPNRMSRLPLLLLLANGITDDAKITEEVKDTINRILKDAWNLITARVLEANRKDEVDDKGATYAGYKLNIFDTKKVKLSLIDKVQICPMTNQLLDYSFRGISPMVKDYFNERTLKKYKIKQAEITIPKHNIKKEDYTENGIFNEKAWRKAVADWFDEKVSPGLQKIGANYSMTKELYMNRPVFITVEHSGQIESEKLRKSEKSFEEGKVNILSCSTTMEMGVDIGGISAVVMNNIPPKPANYLQRAGRAGRRSETQSLSYTICNDNPVGNEVIDHPKWAFDHEIETSRITFSSGTIIQRHVNSLLLGEYIRSTESGLISDEIGAFIFGIRYKDRKKINYTKDGFIEYLKLAKNNDEIIQKIKVITKGTTYELKSNEQMIHKTLGHISRLCKNLEETINGLTEEQEKAELDSEQRYMNYLKFRIESLWEQNMISYLSGHNFLPSNSIPTNLAELVVNPKRGRSEKDKKDKNSIQRQRPIAIQEYAPGNDVTIDNMVYPIVGIDKSRKIMSSQPLEQNISKCSKCGYTAIGFRNIEKCPICESKLKPILNGQKKNSTLTVEPSGFITGPSNRKMKRMACSDFLVPNLLGMEPFKEEDGITPKFRIRSSNKTNGEIVYVNKGKGYGFAYCEYCGKMVPESNLEEVSGEMPTSMKNHKDITKYVSCYGNSKGGSIKRNVLLSASFNTDISEIEINTDLKIKSDDLRTLLYSLGTIIQNTFVNLLGINDGELSFNIIENKRTIFFYDTNSGGAGYANQLPFYIEKVLDLCFEKLDSCKCKRSCTNCLIDKNSQWFTKNLDRHIVMAWLDEEKKSRQNIPNELNTILEVEKGDINKITRNISSEIICELSKRDFNEIDYFLKEELSQDDLLKIIESDLLNAHANHTLIHMIVSHNDSKKKKHPMEFNMQLNTYANRYSPLNTDKKDVASLLAVKSEMGQIIPIIQLKYNDSKTLYFKYNENLYKAINAKDVDLTDYPITLKEEPSFFNFVREFKERELESNQFLSMLFGKHKEQFLKFLEGKDKTVEVSYTDIYVSSPLSCLLLAQTLNQLENLLGLNITKTTINTSRVFKTKNYIQGFLDEDFYEYSDRNRYLRKSIRENSMNGEIFINDRGRLPHARVLKVSNSEFEFILNPDGGFAQGWKAYNIKRSDFSDDKTLPIRLTNNNGQAIRFTLGWKSLKENNK